VKSSRLGLRTFELWEEAAGKRKKYAGTVGPTAMDDVQHAVVGNVYTAIIREVVETAATLADRRLKYELMALKPVTGGTFGGNTPPTSVG
jgi:hypothetical protein